MTDIVLYAIIFTLLMYIIFIQYDNAKFFIKYKIILNFNIILIMAEKLLSDKALQKNSVINNMKIIYKRYKLSKIINLISFFSIRIGSYLCHRQLTDDLDSDILGVFCVEDDEWCFVIEDTKNQNTIKINGRKLQCEIFYLKEYIENVYN